VGHADKVTDGDSVGVREELDEVDCEVDGVEVRHAVTLGVCEEHSVEEPVLLIDTVRLAEEHTVGVSDAESVVEGQPEEERELEVETLTVRDPEAHPEAELLLDCDVVPLGQ
jgi:hypothetical protein